MWLFSHLVVCHLLTDIFTSLHPTQSLEALIVVSMRWALSYVSCVKGWQWGICLVLSVDVSFIETWWEMECVVVDDTDADSLLVMPKMYQRWHQSVSHDESLCLVTAICMSSYTHPLVGDQSGAAAAGDDTAAVNSLVSRCTMNRKAFIELCVTSMVIGALLTVSIIALKAILEQLPVVSSWHIPLLWCVSGPLLYLLGAECDIHLSISMQHQGPHSRNFLGNLLGKLWEIFGKALISN